MRKATAEKLWRDLTDIMGNLMSRWCDESKYEDIKDYQKVLEPHVEKVGGKIYRVTMKSNGSYEYKRL